MSVARAVTITPQTHLELRHQPKPLPSRPTIQDRPILTSAI